METSLDWLLGLAWIAAILPILIASLPSSRFKSFHQLVMGFAGRGKITQPSFHKFTVPQKFFLHFYVWAVLWTTFLLIITWHYAYRMAPLGSDSLDYPTAASHLTGGVHTLSAHMSHFLTAERGYKRQGLSFYTLAPLSLCHFCALEALDFAANQVVEMNVKGHDVGFDCRAYLEPVMRLGWCPWVGAAIFAWGWVHQRRCHEILGSLRKHSNQSDQYVIPRGDWFEIVSSAHYLAEMVIYLGLLVASGGTDFTLWLLLLFVVANLGFSAAETHRWYVQKFEDYPHKRRSIFPFVY